MKNLLNKRVILWDFDGVIVDSNSVRELGFRRVFEHFDKDSVEKLLQYHNENGGLSRYVKIKYFFKNILHQNITQNSIFEYANAFSEIMKLELINKKYIIQETLDFITDKGNNFDNHIVSGSDQEELRFLCQKLGVYDFFITINGSPTPKKELVKNIMRNYGYESRLMALIGDSINDYEAARVNEIDFFGYSNPLLKKFDNYIESFTNY
jgi:HAD superfamily hydrolase (TIGR01549 family)